MFVKQKINIFEKIYDILVILVDFCGNFPWFWLIFCHPDPDPADQIQKETDPSGSGSETLVSCFGSWSESDLKWYKNHDFGWYTRIRFMKQIRVRLIKMKRIRIRLIKIKWIRILNTGLKKGFVYFCCYCLPCQSVSWRAPGYCAQT